MSKQWYPEKQAQLDRDGDYVAFLVATDDPKGASATAWEIRDRQTGKVVLSNAEPSKSKTSGEQRGYLGGLAAILEALDVGSKVEINCRSDYITRAILEWRSKWRENGWKGIEHKEIWTRIEKIEIERCLTVTANPNAKKDPDLQETFEALLTKARSARNARSDDSK